MAQQNEASSVEEILESIKKVIARDNRADALQVRRVRENPVFEANTEPAAEMAHETAPEPVNADEAAEVLDLAEMDGAEIDPDSYEEAFFDDDGDDHTGDDTDADADAPLIGEEVRGAMQENLAALAMLAQPGARPQIVRSGETSLEGLTRELLRPMLAEWLDKNLPGMVEKLVRAEIARIAGKGR